MKTPLDIAIEYLEWIAENTGATFVEKKAKEALREIEIARSANKSTESA